MAADLATADGCSTLIEAAGDVDICVNNAGIFEQIDFFEAADDAWDRHWNVNVMSAMRLSRAFAPAMVDRGWGRIVMLGSESSFNIPTEMIQYGVTKAADVALAQGLAKRLAGTGVTLISMLPGPTLTENIQGLIEATTGATLRVDGGIIDSL